MVIDFDLPAPGRPKGDENHLQRGFGFHSVFISFNWFLGVTLTGAHSPLTLKVNTCKYCNIIICLILFLLIAGLMQD